ncbi:hypothetical protein ACQR0Z_06415 [Bradyrhizobium sp. HKCCYLS3077]|uniref:hypothetical protein n=1 Tax=Bradyrhizobium sp. HKCCYLS3077 TaxID=3420761 RepID=UPI003EBA5D02
MPCLSAARAARTEWRDPTRDKNDRPIDLVELCPIRDHQRIGIGGGESLGQKQRGQSLLDHPILMRLTIRPRMSWQMDKFRGTKLFWSSAATKICHFMT